MKRLYLVFLVSVAVALVPVAVVATIYRRENQRGSQVWEQTKRELAARGESLNPEDFIPPPVPDEQNLAMIPLFARALDYRVNPQTGVLTFGKKGVDQPPFDAMPYGRGQVRAPADALGNWLSGQPPQLSVLQAHYARRDDFPHPPRPGTPAQDVLVALQKFDPALDALSAVVAARPLARFPIDWQHSPVWLTELPHCGLVQKLTTVLCQRALANLASGRHAEAARDVATMGRLRAAIQTEPTVIAHLIVLVCDGLLLQTVWAGLAERRWTADELRDLQRVLRADDLLPDAVRVQRGERAHMVCRTFDEFRRAGNMLQVFRMDDQSYDPGKLVSVWMTFQPRGWVDQNEATACRRLQQIIDESVDLGSRRVRPERLRALLAASQRERKESTKIFAPHTYVGLHFLPVHDSVLRRATRVQTGREQAEVACALERYFLNHQTYPASLPSLLPTYLNRVPTDLVDGAPMRYQPADHGRYVLYGVGWDGRDDGGRIVWRDGAGSVPEDRSGDWVWRYPADEPTKGQ